MTRETKIPVQMQVCDAETGQVIEERPVNFILMPVDTSAGQCPVCGQKHEPREPHNAQSPYYQYRIYGETGKWPTWADAVAHCDPLIQWAWYNAISERGVWTGPAPQPASPEVCCKYEQSYERSSDGESITFYPCWTKSHHPDDIKNAYCGRCHSFIEKEADT